VQAEQEAVVQEQAGVVSEWVSRRFDGRTEENNDKSVRVVRGAVALYKRGTFRNLARNN
jgi:hypothetical protein